MPAALLVCREIGHIFGTLLGHTPGDVAETKVLGPPWI